MIHGIWRLVCVGVASGLVLVSYGAEQEEKGEDPHHLWSTYVQCKNERLALMSSGVGSAEQDLDFVAACKAEQDQQNKLVTVIRKGSTDQVQQLLNARMDPNLRPCSLSQWRVDLLNVFHSVKLSVGDEHRPLLHEAVFGRNSAVARLLLAAKADAHAMDLEQNTALQVAVNALFRVQHQLVIKSAKTHQYERERDEIESFCKFLVREHGANLYSVNRDGDTPKDTLERIPAQLGVRGAPHLLPHLKMMAKQYKQFQRGKERRVSAVPMAPVAAEPAKKEKKKKQPTINPLLTDLFDLIERQDSEQVQEAVTRLIGYGIDPNTLCPVVKNERGDWVSGSDEDSQAVMRETLLYRIADQDQGLEKCRILVKAKANPNVIASNEWSPLIKIAKTLLHLQIENHWLIDTDDGNLPTAPLLRKDKMDDIESRCQELAATFKYLIREGANPDYGIYEAASSHLRTAACFLPAHYAELGDYARAVAPAVKKAKEEGKKE